MRHVIDLGGAWERRDFLDEAWRWSDALRPTVDPDAGAPPIAGAISAGWRAARVPGSAIDDAWRAGEIHNPYVDRHSLAAEWIPQRTWLYRRTITVPDGAFDRAVLHFDGIDPGGTILLDGVEVGRHRGMFRPCVVELTDRLERGGHHDLVVAVDPAPPMPSQVGRTEDAREHRSRMTYGWDFCPRMIHTGIWRPVSLELAADAWLEELRVTVDADAERAGVDMVVASGGSVHGARLDIELISDDGEVVASLDHAATGKDRLRLDASGAARWWPNGAGEPVLHRLRVRLARAGSVLDEREARIGLRSIGWEANPGAPAGALAYTAIVNGRRTWLRGWNWVPIDPAFGVPRPARLRHLVELARRANVNLLRVWGGGLVESQAFYDACDAAGIMVWQEFALSSSGVSNRPADDSDFVGRLAAEAEELVAGRAHHPSLVRWGGGNELTDAENRPLDDRHPAIAALRGAVETAGGGAGWLPTSPSGPRFDNRIEAIAAAPDELHDVHGPWEHQGLAHQHELANATTSLLHSEFGVEGMTNLATLRATVTDHEAHATDRTHPVMAHRGAWWNNRPFVESAFGAGLTLEDLERASQHLQADGLRTLVDGDRRRAPRNAGALPWQLNEPFPNAWSTAALDGFGRPKAAYHAVAEAYRSIVVGLAWPTQALDGAPVVEIVPWVGNATSDLVEGHLVVRTLDIDGQVLDEHRQPIRAEPDASRDGRAVMCRLPHETSPVLVLEGRLEEPAGEVVASTRRIVSRTANLEPLRRLSTADLEVVVDAEADRWRLTLRVRGTVAAVEVRVVDARPVGWPERPGGAYAEASHLTLLPGEIRDVVVAWLDVPPADRCLRVDAWNVAPLELRADG